MSGRPEAVEPFLRGCVWPAAEWASYPRCDPGPLGQRLPADTRGQAAVPVGVRLEFIGEPEALEIEYETATDELGYRGAGAGTHFALFRGTRRVSEAKAELGEGCVRMEAGRGPEPGILYLPEGMRPTVRSVRGVGAAIAPAPPRPRWLCYGDSIAEGWVASEPASAWPARVGRERGSDVVNLAYAGAARGELVSAEELASLPAELISLAHGTNCWTRVPHDAAHFRTGLESFLALLREGHPHTPVVAISPVLRADAERQPNRLGACLADLRRAFEEAVNARVRAGDRHLELVPGLPLLAAERFPDGIHPDDEGHAQMAAALGPVLQRAFARAREETS